MELNYTVLIALGSSIVTFAWTVYQYSDTKRREQDLKEFENYHQMIKDLVQPEADGKTYYDRQTAIMYELRHFKRYYSYSYRLLTGLKETWIDKPQLLAELNLTLDFLKDKK